MVSLALEQYLGIGIFQPNKSPLTINTHRSNIIKKAGKSSITDVIRDLKAKGLL